MIRKNDKKSRLIQAAHQLFREKSYYSTTLAMIAEAANVPLGNVYYYFKSKESLLTAVLDRLVDGLHSNIKKLDELSTQRERIKAFVQSIADRAPELALYGDPFILLARELRLEDEDIRKKPTEAMQKLAKWFTQQFLGLSTEPQHQAHYLLQRLYGIIALANCSNNPQYIIDHCSNIITEIE